MKKLISVVFMLALLSVFHGCEKAYEEESKDRTEQPGDSNVQPDDDEDDWNDDDDQDDGGISLGDEVDVATFCNTPIYTQVWVRGYIVGAATGANGKIRYEFEPPFSYDTAILMADSPTADDETEVMSVCLTSCTKVLREELNLVSHPENRGKRLRVFGFQETYLKLPGIKKIDAYDF